MRKNRYCKCENDSPNPNDWSWDKIAAVKKVRDGGRNHTGSTVRVYAARHGLDKRGALLAQIPLSNRAKSKKVKVDFVESFETMWARRAIR